jgi:hypothetical protein
VDVGPRFLGEPEVGRVADQDVPEAEAVVPREERAIRFDEVLARQREERRADVLTRERADRAAAELTPDHGRAFEDAALLRLERIEPRDEEGVDRRGDHLAGADLGLQRQQLLQEERVPLRGRGDPRPLRLVEHPVAAHDLDELLGLVLRQRLERDRHAPRRAFLEQLRPREAEEDDRCPAAPAGQVFDQVEEGRLGPLELVDADHERSRTREVLEHPADRPEGLLAAAGGGAGADGASDVARDALCVLGAVERGRDPLGREVADG